MRAPYASIIVPTHDRHATLALAIRSALNQTVRDIEVVIVGDGCTDKVRAISRNLAAEDARVRFLDRPKAPLRGAANRDFAVRTALAPRIFYSDDDDLLLAHHVEVLGAELDRSDIVDTPPASVGTEGRVSLGLHDSGHPLQRRLLLGERYKGVFDTHLAHRKEVYTQRAGAWMNAKDHRVVLHMLKTFAAARDLRWNTLNRITALSFHGTRRVTMTPQARAREIRDWTARIADPGLEADLRRTGGYCAHVLPMADALASEPKSEQHDLLERIGLMPAADIALHTARKPRAAAIVPNKAQRAALDAALAVAQGTRPILAGAARALDELLDPVLGPRFLVEWSLRRFAAHISLDELGALLTDLPERPALVLARFHLAVAKGSVSDTDRVAVRSGFETAPSESRFFFGLSVTEGLSRLGDLSAAWEWTNALLPLAPESRHAIRFWETRNSLASRTGRGTEEAIAADRIAGLAQGMV